MAQRGSGRRPLQHTHVFPPDALAYTVGRLDIKASACSDGHTAYPSPEMDAFLDDRLDHITGLKAFDPFLVGEVVARAALFNFAVVNTWCEVS